MFLVFTFKGGKKYFNKQGYLKGMDHFKAHRWSELLFQLVFHGNFGNITLSVGGTECHFSFENHAKTNASDKKMGK